MFWEGFWEDFAAVAKPEYVPVETIRRVGKSEAGVDFLLGRRCIRGEGLKISCSFSYLKKLGFETYVLYQHH